MFGYTVNKPSDAVNTGIASRQRDVDLRFTQGFAFRTLPWLGLAYTLHIIIIRKVCSGVPAC
jgi:hypothetical protein